MPPSCSYTRVLGGYHHRTNDMQSSSAQLSVFCMHGCTHYCNNNVYAYIHDGLANLEHHKKIGSKITSLIYFSAHILHWYWRELSSPHFNGECVEIALPKCENTMKKTTPQIASLLKVAILDWEINNHPRLQVMTVLHFFQTDVGAGSAGPLDRLLNRFWIWKRFWEGIATGYNTGTGFIEQHYSLTHDGPIRTKAPSPDNRPIVLTDYWTDFESENGFEKVLPLDIILVQIL
jgi:hypothetical protein